MGDVIRCEGLGAVNIYDLVARLSEKKPILKKVENENNKKQQKKKNPKHRFHCPRADCQRSFCSQVALDNHVERHTRTYTCEVCDKVFTEQAKVIKTHTLSHFKTK